LLKIRKALALSTNASITKKGLKTYNIHVFLADHVDLRRFFSV
jgi:hypothetical protein